MPSFCLACRYCPQNSFLIASKTVSADVLVFDYTKHDSQPTDNKCTPWIRCVGHEKEGYGLDWSPLEEGRLLSAADDHWVCEWDIRGNTKGEAKLNAKSKYTGHSNVVEVKLGAGRLQHAKQTVIVLVWVLQDVAWHRHHKNLFGSVGDDKKLLM